MSTIPPPPPATHPVNFWIARSPSRSRISVFFRLILALPLVVLEQVWSSVMQVVAVIQWAIVTFTGKRNTDLRKLQLQYLTFASRAYTYLGLLYDSYPPFGESSPSPVQLNIDGPGVPPRASAIFRIVLAVPAFIVTWFVIMIGTFVTIFAWFTVLVTGSMSEGMHHFLMKVHRYVVRTLAYATLVVDAYPRWN
jgi:hypothetical protein